MFDAFTISKNLKFLDHFLFSFSLRAIANPVIGTLVLQHHWSQRSMKKKEGDNRKPEPGNEKTHFNGKCFWFGGWGNTPSKKREQKKKSSPYLVVTFQQPAKKKKNGVDAHSNWLKLQNEINREAFFVCDVVKWKFLWFFFL